MALKPARLQWSGDGSLTSLDYGDVYFQHNKGLEESRYVFLDGSRLNDRFAAAQDTFHIAEAGFGSGLNFLLTAELFARIAPKDARLFYASFEKHPVPVADLQKIYSHFSELREFANGVVVQYPPAIEGFHTLHFLGGRIRLMLCFGDFAETLPQLDGMFDAWYLDGFSPRKNPAMWDKKIYPQVAAHTKPGGTLATFSSAGHVRRALKEAGFEVKKIKGYGIKWSMTTARMPGEAVRVMRKHIAILGAGVAGCSAAYALAQRGHRVTLFDKHGDIAAETSGNPVGIVYPKLTVDPSPLGLFHSHAFLFTRVLLKNIGLPSWQECGVTHLDLDAEERKRTEELFRRNEFPEDYAALQVDGYHQPTAGFLSPPEFCRALAKDVEINKADICELRQEETVWRVNGQVFDTVVIASGHGSRAFAQTGWLPLQSLRGQITQLKPTTQSAALGHVICHDGYITPVREGLHCIGATFQKEEPEGTDTRAEDDIENLDKLNRRLPQYGFTPEHIAGSRSGYRATTPDKLPLAGPCPDYAKMTEDYAALRSGSEVDATPSHLQNLYISTGFGAHGMTGAPLAGEIIASMISGDPLPVPRSLLQHLLPERFILRDLKRRKI